MKKFINIFLIILLSLSVCSCGGNNKSSTPLEKALAEIEARVPSVIDVWYDADVVGRGEANTTVKDLGNGRYEYSGYYTFRDSFGNNCRASYSGNITINETDGTYTWDYSIGACQRYPQ